MSTEIVERGSEWYMALAEDCHAIVVEKTKIAQQELTEMYLLIGERILEDAKRAPITKIVEAVSTDIRIGKANLWYAVAVVKKFGADVNKLPLEGAKISWNQAKKLVSGSALPAGVEIPTSNFDPYEHAHKLWAKQNPDDCYTVSAELLRLFREAKL